jgi:xylulokinase
MTAHGMLEGLALQARWMLDEQVRVAGLDRIGGVTVLAGRAVTNTTWLRLKAAATPAPVRLVRADEPVAAGAALIGAERAGLTDGAAAGLPSDPLVVPDHPHAAHDAALARFVAAARRRNPKEFAV